MITKIWGSPADFVTAAVCLESDDGADTSAQDTAEPSPGFVLHYLVRAGNACPVGEGTLGFDSVGGERVGRACP